MTKLSLIASALAVLGLTACEKGLDETVDSGGSGQVKNSLLQVRTRGGGSTDESTVAYPLQVYVFSGDECKAAQTIGDEGQTLNIALVDCKVTKSRAQNKGICFFSCIYQLFCVILQAKKKKRESNMLRIAVQSKGRLYEDTMNLLAEADIKVSASKRTLLVQSSNFPLEVLYLRDDDIPQSVASGVADIGVVGENEFVERGEDADIISRLGFSQCRLSLAIPKEIEYRGVNWFNGKKIATSYPNILRDYMKEMGVDCEIHVITGSVEISPGIGLADGIFDIVSSGSTLVSNNLREVEVVMKSEALLIGNKNMSRDKRATLDEMLFRFKAVKDAEDKKYVRMNAPKARLQEIIDVLPGLKSPTIIPLADEEWCSVHTVLDQKRFWEIIGKLKEMGAQGILVTPIEKMIL